MDNQNGRNGFSSQLLKQPISNPPIKKSFYNYKAFVLISVAILLVSIGILANNYLTTGDFLKRGLELKGGTSIILNLQQQTDTTKLQIGLSSKFQDISVREIRGVSGYELSVEAPADADTNEILQELQSLGIQTEKHSIRNVGAALGASFFQQVQVGLIVSFILMAIVVFLMFRTFAPSTAVLLAAISDILETMAAMSLLGINLTLSTFAALLMLIGYSVDTDLLLTSRVLKSGSELSISERIKGAFKTGMTMNLTTLAVLSVLFISNLSPILSEIASVLIIGIVFDLVNTWIQNVAIIRRYAEKKGL